jgi:Tfp pilus assembly protein PilF
MSALLQQAATYYARGQFQQAQDLCDQLIASTPENTDAWHLRGVLALRSGEFPQAIDLFKRAIALKSDDYAVHVNLATALRQSRRFEEGIAACDHAITLNPACAEAHMNLGYCRMGLGQFDEAVDAFTAAVTLRRDWPDALEGMGQALFHTKQHEQALEYALATLALEPRRAISHRLAGDIYGYLPRLEYDAALKHYATALEIAPDDSVTQSHLALVLARMGRNEEAAALYRQALSMMPNDAATRHGLSQMLLSLGQFTEGWPLYYARRLLAVKDLSDRAEKIAPAADRAIKGKRILAWTDQGIGEEIMFANLIPDLLRGGAKLSVECEPRLVPLFARSFPDVDIIPRQEVRHPKLYTKFDGQIALPDCAAWFRGSFADFPRHGGYLKADAALSRKMRASYQGAEKRPLIGIAWRTSRTKVYLQKSLALKDWGPILRVPGAIFVNLQYGSDAEEIAAAEQAFGIRIISDPAVDALNDLDTFAAQVAAMDLIVTTSNATAHMAGALNIPAWTFVPKGMGAAWHWFLDRSDSPWYPSLRLVRQAALNDWQPVVEAAAAMLTEFTSVWHSDKGVGA